MAAATVAVPSHGLITSGHNGVWPVARQPASRQGGPARNDEEGHMPMDRPDGRHCPRCGARGIVTLLQHEEPSGGIRDPIHNCPACGETWQAKGTLLLAPVTDLTDGGVDQLAQVVADGLIAAALGREGEVSPQPPWIDPA